MPHRLEDDPTLSTPDRKLLAIVRKHGWHVTVVLPSDDEPGYAYTTGLYLNFDHPEVILFGLDARDMHAILNLIGDQVKAGTRFKDGDAVPDLEVEDRACQMHRVDQTRYRQYALWSEWFYEGSAFPMLQCFWPDYDGRFPWDPRCDPDLARMQPCLFEADATVSFVTTAAPGA